MRRWRSCPAACRKSVRRRYHGACYVVPTRLLLTILGTLTILRYGALDERRQMHPAAHTLIVMEMQLRNAAQLHHPPEMHSQEARSILQCRQIERGIFITGVAHQGDEDLGVSQIATDFGSSDGDHADPRVTHLTLDQHSQLALHLIGDPLGTTIFFGHIYLWLHATSCWLQAHSCSLAAICSCLAGQTTNGPFGPLVTTAWRLSLDYSVRATCTRSNTSMRSPTRTSL